jgi:hypothetical protein
LVAANKHEITILSRNVRNDLDSPHYSLYIAKIAQVAPAGYTMPGLTWRAVNYHEKSELVEVLQGIHTVLSFIQLMTDPEKKAEKNLIDAAIVAGVKRFAPSEWGR